MLDDKKSLTAFRRKIIAWYAKHARPLPWRGTTDPYRIWVSEIMLQQTTTKTVEGYFDRFIERFPTVRGLAEAELDQVSRLWEGLGYYRRCAQMHKAAREIVDRFHGVFPDRPEDVRSLPGIGRYTAGAILSIAFDRREPILEANTLRLHARLTGLRADPTRGEANETLWNFAERILPTKHVGRFNQALMDLGSGVCTPSTPRCGNCPIVAFCAAAQAGLQASIPCRKEKEEKIDRTEVAVQVRRGKKVLMVRYPMGVRWANLWDFPRAEANAEIPLEITMDSQLTERLAEMTGRKLAIGHLIDSLRHVVTRYRITLFFCHAADTGKTKHAPTFETGWFSPEEIEHLPMNSTARKLAKHLR